MKSKDFQVVRIAVMITGCRATHTLPVQHSGFSKACLAYSEY